MRKFIIENGLTPGWCIIPKGRKKTDEQASEKGTNDLMSTMERTCIGIINLPLPSPTNTSHKEYSPMILD